MDGEKEDAVLDHAIYYFLDRLYPRELTKEKKRAVWKWATNLVVEKGEIFLKYEIHEIRTLWCILQLLLITHNIYLYMYLPVL